MEYRNRMQSIWIVVVGLFFISSCDIIDSLKKDKDDDNGGDQIEFVDGISRDILEFVSEEELSILEDTLGVQIYRGNNPPLINGSFKMSPVLLNNSNVPNDFAQGHRFADVYLKFYNQNDELFTIEIDKVETNPTTDDIISTSVGVGSYVIGDGNGFSIFAKIESQRATGEESVMLQLYTGILTENGVQNLQSALLMLNNYGRNDIFIANGSGRSFVDGDEFSEQAEFPTSKMAISSIDKLIWPSGNLKPVQEY